MHFHLMDLGGELRLSDAARLLGTDAPGKVAATKHAPAYADLVASLRVPLGQSRLDSNIGPLEARTEMSVYAIGAVGILTRTQFEVQDLAALQALAFDARLARAAASHARELASEHATRLHDILRERYTASVEPETYLVIVITQAPITARELFEDHRRALAGLVSGEPESARLSDEEVGDNLRVWYRYFDDDLVILDWDRALIVEPTARYDDVLRVIEAANLELLELRAYDRYLDVILELAYDDLSKFYGRGGLFRSARGVQAELSDARIDLVRVTDAINNIGKLFGDYFLAKVHLGLADRYHLREWENIVREKMATLNELYVLASHEVEHRRGVALETMIVLLFILDLVLLFALSL